MQHTTDLTMKQKLIAQKILVYLMPTKSMMAEITKIKKVFSKQKKIITVGD